MPSEGSRLWLTLGCVLILLGGCASVPPAPASAQNAAKPGEDEYEGWLFKSLTGKKTPPPAAPNTAAGGVQQASAVSPVTADGAGPLIPGPASPSLRGVAAPPSGPAQLPDLSDTTAGPPPSLPPELPSPAKAVSIKDSQSQAEKDKEKEKKGFEWSDLAPENIYKNIKKAAGYGPNEQIARKVLADGKSLYVEKKYKEAAAQFATAAARWPDSPLEEDAMFLEGESEFFSDQYPKAHDTYGGLLKKYTNTRYLDTVVAREFALGRYWEQLQDTKPLWLLAPNVTDHGRPMFDTFGYAIQAYERVRLNDPTGPLADASLMAMGNAYFRIGRYEDAASNYDLLRKEYPNSKYQALAHVLDLQAKMRVYQGTMYDQGPLNDANKIADQALRQFDKELGAERERVMKARAQIIEEKANREFVLGAYYDQHKYYGAARMYYQSVIDSYPNSEKAKEAQSRMESIRDLPDSPPNYFKWLTDPFGTKK